MKFSLNLNKIALLRNARGENYPSLEEYANKAILAGFSAGYWIMVKKEQER